MAIPAHPFPTGPRSCGTAVHRHEPPPGCTYPAQRPSGYCGRTPVRAYIGGRALEYRCSAHANEAAEQEAIRLGYQPKSVRIEAVQRATDGAA